MDAMILNREWSTRPEDERFLDLPSLHAYNVAKRARSVEKGIALDHLRVEATETGALKLRDPNNGRGGSDMMFRGIIARQSEVGSAAFDLFCFLYRRICDNRIIHGLGQSKHLKIRHTSGGPMRFLREARPQLQAYLTAGTTDTVEMISAARTREVAQSDAGVKEWLKARGFTATQTQSAVEKASQEDGLNPRSLWGVVQGLTDHAKTLTYGDERLDLERKAGKLLDAVAF